MDQELKATFRKTGFFVIIAALILIVFVAVIVSKQRLFVKKHIYYTTLEDAVGLSVSSTVVFKGYDIGRIMNYSFDQNNNILVRFFIYNDFHYLIVENSAVAKNYNPITARANLELLKGPSGGDILPELSMIPSLDMEEGRRLLADRKIRALRSDPVSRIMANVDDFIANLTRDDNYDQGSFFRMVFHLAEAAENMNESLTHFNSLILALQDDNNAEEGVLLRLLVNLADLAEDVRVSNSLLAENMLELNKVLVEYGDPDGLLLRMIDPTEEIFVKPLRKSMETLNSNLEDIQEILGFIKSTTPEISLLMIQSRKSLSDVQKTLQGIMNNPLIRGGIEDETIPSSGQRVRPQTAIPDSE